MNNALLSRCRVIILEKLTTENIVEIIRRSAKAIDIEVFSEGKKSEKPNSDGVGDLDNER